MVAGSNLLIPVRRSFLALVFALAAVPAAAQTPASQTPPATAPGAQPPAAAQAAWLAWYATMPDAPCIAICSTSQGDAICKGCGRSFEEVQRWTAMSPAEKRATWRRITQDGSAWRFNRYAERARPGAPEAEGAAEAVAGSAS